MTNNSNYKRAKIISSLFEAPLIALIAFLILSIVLEPQNFLKVEIVCLLFATILPIAFFLSYGKLHGIDRDFTDRTKRNLPLLVAVVIYFIGFLILNYIQANPIITILMFCYALNTLIVFCVNLKWKISIHAIGVSGPTTALMFVSPFGFILGLLAPFLMWSRLTLKKHTPLQLLAGSLVGYVFTIFPMYYTLIKLNYSFDISISKWLFVVLALISIISYFALKDREY